MASKESTGGWRGLSPQYVQEFGSVLSGMLKTVAHPMNMLSKLLGYLETDGPEQFRGMEDSRK